GRPAGSAARGSAGSGSRTPAPAAAPPRRRSSRQGWRAPSPAARAGRRARRRARPRSPRRGCGSASARSGARRRRCRRASGCCQRPPPGARGGLSPRLAGLEYDPPAMAAGEPTLYVIPGSHPAMAVRRMLELKGVPYRRVDLMPVISRAVLRGLRFPAGTVPAMRVDGERISGSRAIARDHGPLRSYAEGARLGVPLGLAVKAAAPIVAAAKRINRAGDEAVRGDLAALPGYLDRVDAWIAEGVLGGEQLGAADLQIAGSLRLAMTMDDLRPHIERRPAGELALRAILEFPGRFPPVLPADWLEPLRGAPA